METVQATATVEDLLAGLAAGTTGFRVVNDDGNVLGLIGSKTVLAVLDRDRERRP